MNDPTNDNFCPFCDIDLRENPEHVTGDCRDVTLPANLALLKACAQDDTHRALYLRQIHTKPDKLERVRTLLCNDRAALSDYLAFLTGDDPKAWALTLALF